MKARVRTFLEGEIEINVEKVWFWNGEPLRVWGDGRKFKQDEEPFTLIGECMWSDDEQSEDGGASLDHDSL